MRRTKFILLIVIGLLFNSCAMIYRPVNPPTLNYKMSESKDGIELSYKYDVLQLKGNKKYAKSEDRAGVRLVAVRIVNNTDSTINIGTDALFYSGIKPVELMTPYLMENTIKQSTAAYLPYLLFTFLRLNVSSGYYNTVSIPIGYFLGPMLTLGNIITANSANKNLLKELNTYDILNKDIQKGETVYGLIGIEDAEFLPLSIKINKEPTSMVIK
jgi:hypothetical protein